MGSPAIDGTPPPPVHLLSVSGLDETGKPVVISPGSGNSVAQNTTLRLKFDRFLLPTSAIRQSICVQHREAATVDDCLTPVSFSVAYDPARREVIYRLQTDQNGGNIPLMSGNYVLTLFQPSATDPASVGFRAFDGAILDKQYAIDVKVSNKMAPAGSDGPPTSQAFWCNLLDNKGNLLRVGAENILGTNCGVSGCHYNTLDVKTQKFLPAAMGLQFNADTIGGGDKNAIEAIARTAINHVAHETQIGEHADQGEASPDRFGRAMPIIDAQSAGNSYLLYKLLIGQDTMTHVPFIADSDERQRLRDGFVVDDPMPLPNGAMAPHPVQMNATWIDTLSSWIQSGAGMPECP